MRKLVVVCVFLFGSLAWTGGSAQEGSCQADGRVQFLCGPVSPEDLAPIPDTPWVIVASMVDNGDIYLADARDYSSDVVYPTATSVPRHDTTTYGACPGPVTRDLRPHGLYLRRGAGDVHTLFVVGHGAREAIEVFEVAVDGIRPSLTWIGCSVAPDGLALNSVVGLSDGGFVVTSPATGDIWEWHPGGDWVRVPGSEGIGPNGIEISADGETLYVGGYGDQALIRLSRGRDPVVTDRVPVGFHIDNVRWGPGNTLLAAGHRGPTRASIGACIREGQCDGVGSHVARVDLDTMAAERVVDYPSNDLLILGTVAIQVGDEIWMGGVAEGDRIARFPVP